MYIPNTKLTKEETIQLGRDINTAVAKVLRDWGFSNEEITKVMNLPESSIRRMLSE